MSSSGIAVTGAGVTIPSGLSVPEAWDRALRSESAISGGSLPEETGPHWPGRAVVPQFDVTMSLRHPKNQKFMSPTVRFLLRSAKEAIDASGLDLSTFTSGERVGAYVASGHVGPEPNEFFRAFNVARDAAGEGDYGLLGGRASRLIDPYFPLRTLANSGLALLAIEFGIHGPTNNFGQSDVAGFFALDEAIRDLQERRCDVAVVGAYDSLLSATNYMSFMKAGLLSSSDHSKACRPFDQQSEGLVLGEGAGVIVLERSEDAAARSASILAEIEVYGSGWDNGSAFWPEFMPEGHAGNGVASSATVGPDAALMNVLGTEHSAGFVVASGFGVPAWDRSEAAALCQALADDVPVTALKSLTGYLGAATAIVETVLAIQALREGAAPPVARLCTPWPEAKLNFVRSAPMALSGPCSATVVTRSWTGQCAGIGVACC